MTEHEFFDSNIILYAQIDDSSLKHKQAVDLLTDRIINGDTFVSVQVLNERNYRKLKILSVNYWNHSPYFL
ncbi:hypothetical protein AGMMS49944_22690 [Spirochaetia bacterium]|nr:hypothetical protein AGMMS49944_22690 [Spirochaetia bacterium]